MTSDVQFAAASTCVFPSAHIEEKRPSSMPLVLGFFSPPPLSLYCCRVMTASGPPRQRSNRHCRPSQACFQLHIFQQPRPRLGLFGSSRNDRVIGLHGSLPVFDNLPHLLSGLSGQAAYKSFTGLINCLKSAPLPGK